MFRKNESDGSYDLIAGAANLEKLRRRRESYEKAPLVRPRNSFVTFIENLFRRRPDPFALSPIASDISRRIKLESELKRLEKRGLDDLAIADLFLVKQINKALDGRIDDSRARADNALDTLDADLDQEEAFLDHCRPDKIRSDMLSDLQSKGAEFTNALLDEAKSDAEHHVDLDEFRRRNNLHRTDSWGKRLSTGIILGLVGVIVFEFMLNMFFFSGTDPTGFVGASGVAMILAFATIFLGCFFGIAYQHTHPMASGKGWVGWIMLPFLVFATAFYLLLLTLVRLAGEAGELKPVSAAGDMMIANPFQGLLNLPALAYFFFTIGIISLVAWKYVSINGRFPGLRDRHLAALDSNQDFDDRMIELLGEARAVASRHVELLDRLPNFIQQTVLPIKLLVMGHENVVDQYRDDIRDIEDAGELLFGFVYQELGGGRAGTLTTLRKANDLKDAVNHYDERDRLFKQRAGFLIDRDTIKPEALERCRAAMHRDAEEEIKKMEEGAARLREDRRANRRREGLPVEAMA